MRTSNHHNRIALIVAVSALCVGNYVGGCAGWSRLSGQDATDTTTKAMQDAATTIKDAAQALRTPAPVVPASPAEPSAPTSPVSAPAPATDTAAKLDRVADALSRVAQAAQQAQQSAPDNPLAPVAAGVGAAAPLLGPLAPWAAVGASLISVIGTWIVRGKVWTTQDRVDAKRDLNLTA